MQDVPRIDAEVFPLQFYISMTAIINYTFYRTLIDLLETFLDLQDLQLSVSLSHALELHKL